jgi:competence CoiA-like predicted nuclease
MVREVKRTIKEVLNFENGKCIDANEFFKKPLDEITVYRSELQKAINGFRDPLFKCYYCKQLIRIRGGMSEPNKRKAEIFHFAHLKDSDDCHIKTNNQFTKEEVDRIKYNGAKESLLHQKIKENIADSLRRNQENNKGVTQIEVERVISDKVDKEWKKPDINAYFQTKRLAIELQLSTTWLDVITRRQHFYKEHGIYILWVFNEFNLDDDVRKLTFNDVVYTNNQNAYVFDDEMYERSIAENDLILKCYYKTYYKNIYNEIEEEWEDSVIRLSDLTFDEKNFRIFYHDSEKQKREIELKISTQKRIEEKAHKQHVLRMNEEKLAKEKHVQEVKEKKGNLENIISDLTSEIREIKILQKEYLANEVDFKEKLKENKELLQDIDNLTDKKIKHLAELHFFSSFYDNNVKLKELNSEFGEGLRLAVGIKKTKNQELNSLSVKIDRNKAIPVKLIAGKSYSNLDKTKFWEFIEGNFSKVKVIHKDSVGNLFEGDGIKSINSSSELFQYKVSSNYLFLIDLSQKIKDLDDEISECRKIISEQESIVLTIKDEVRKKLTTHLQLDIQELENKIGTNSRIQAKYINELEQKESELATNNSALFKLKIEDEFS